MSKKNRGANCFYVTNVKNWKDAQGDYSIVSVANNGWIRIKHNNGSPSIVYEISRSHARMLARRLIQALESTKCGRRKFDCEDQTIVCSDWKPIKK